MSVPRKDRKLLQPLLQGTESRNAPDTGKKERTDTIHCEVTLKGGGGKKPPQKSAFHFHAREI